MLTPGVPKEDPWDNDLPPDQTITWARTPVPLLEYAMHPYFLGFGEEVYPGVRDAIEEIEETTPDEIVLTGGTGWGKTFLGDLLIGYDDYLVSCLQNPHALYGLAKGYPIVFVVQSVTEKKARKAIFDGLERRIRQSPYYNDFHRPNLRLKTELAFENNSSIRPVAAHPNALISENIVGAILDETNFQPVVVHSARSLSPHDVYDVAKENYKTLSRRRKSRHFVQQHLPGHVIMISSARHPGDFTEEMKEKARDPQNRILVINKATWDTRPRSWYKAGSFKVLVGRGASRSRVMGDEEPAPIDAEVIEVPDDFRKDFTEDVEQALRDHAGVATQAIHPYIVRRELVQATIRTGLVHPFDQQVTTLRNGIAIIAEHLHRKANYWRAVHMDLAKSGDAAGLAWGYVRALGKIERTPVEVASAEGTNRTITMEGGRYYELAPIIVIEGMLRVTAPANDEILLADVTAIPVTLRDEFGVPIRWVTADQYQSLGPLQSLRARGFITGEVSVEDPEPYGELKAAINDGRLETYSYGPFLSELLALERNEKNGKVDHPTWAVDLEGRRVKGSKDVADAVAGVVHVLSNRPESWRPITSGVRNENARRETAHIEN